MMKKIYTKISLVVGLIIAIAMVSCVKELDNTTVEYVGTVVEKSTMKGIPKVRVIITNGDKIYQTDTTDNNGKFSLKDVNVDEIDDNYYILIDGSPIGLPSKKEDLKGFGQKQFDYKTIPLYDKTTMELYPVVSKTTVSDVTTTTAVCKATVTLATDGLAISDKGFVWSLSQDPILENSENGRLSLGEGPGELTGNLTNLIRNTTYYIRAYATNSVSATYGEQATFITTEGLPTISINEVTNIAATSATCGGSISSNGGYAVTDKGLVWSTTQDPVLNDGSSSHISLGSGNSNFTGTMTNLAMSTTYYVKAYATNDNGTIYSAQKSFTTTDGLPVVKTNPVSNVLATSATCGGSITSDGGFAVTDKGLVWSTNQYPTINDSHISLGSGNTAFTGSMTNLSMSTTYYVRAYATNSTGTSYGEQYDFTTNNGLPTVTTTTVTFNNGTLVSGGNVTSDGGFNVTARGICYGVLPNPDLTSTYTHTTDGTGTGYYSSTITLPNGTETFYVRAYATNENGTAYGPIITCNYSYLTLPTFQFNGHTYRVAPDPLASTPENGSSTCAGLYGPYTVYTSWSAAYSYCENLTAYGYSDWRMPTREELELMYQNRNSIGGFIYGYYTTTASVGSYGYHCLYHTSTGGSGSHVKINWRNGSSTTSYESGCYDGSQEGSNACYIHHYRCHVRPIRVEN